MKDFVYCWYRIETLHISHFWSIHLCLHPRHLKQQESGHKSIIITLSSKHVTNYCLPVPSRRSTRRQATWVPRCGIPNWWSSREWTDHSFDSAWRTGCKIGYATFLVNFFIGQLKRKKMYCVTYLILKIM